MQQQQIETLKAVTLKLTELIEQINKLTTVQHTIKISFKDTSFTLDTDKPMKDLVFDFDVFIDGHVVRQLLMSIIQKSDSGTNGLATRVRLNIYKALGRYFNDNQYNDYVEYLDRRFAKFIDTRFHRIMELSKGNYNVHNASGIEGELADIDNKELANELLSWIKAYDLIPGDDQVVIQIKESFMEHMKEKAVECIATLTY